MSATQQALQLDRVRGRVQTAVLEFWRSRMLASNPSFRADDLRRFVQARNPGSAPDSSMRVLRVLRTEGRANYRNTERSGSLYVALPLGEPVFRHSPSAEAIADLQDEKRDLRELLEEVREELSATVAALESANLELAQLGRKQYQPPSIRSVSASGEVS